MARSTPLAVRFSTEGFDDLRKQLKSAGQSFESAMNKAMEASKEAIAAGKVAAEGTKEWKDAQADLVRAAKAANNAVAGAFRELNVRTTASIDAQKKAAISAFEAIKKSGVASAQDIANAQASLNKKLKDLEAQKDQTNKNDPEKQRLAALEEAYKSLGVASRASLEAQKEAAKEAFDAIKNSGTATFEELSEARKNYHARITAIDARINQYSPEEVRKRKALEAQRAIVDSYQRLGVQSIESLQRQRQEAIAAYKKIKNSGTASYKDIIAAQKAMDAQLEALDRQIDEHAQGWDKVKVMGKNALNAIKTKLTTLDVGVKNSTEGFTVMKGVLANLISGGIQAGLSAIANTLQSMTRAVIGFGQQSVGVFMQFDGAMKAFAAKSGAAPELISMVADETKRLGMETSKTPAAIASMAASLAAAGFTAQETKDAMRGVVMASEASGESLETAGDIIGASLNQFRLGADQSARVANVLSAAANGSATSISGLGEGLKFIGPIAGASNQSIEDMAIAIGMLTNAGMQGGMAGRNLASAFERLQKASAGVTDGTVDGSAALKGQQEALKKLGVEFRQADGQMRPLLEVLPELNEAFKRLDYGERDLVRTRLFGSEGGRAINNLLGQVDTKMQGLVDSVMSANDGIGTAAETSQQLMKGLGPALKLMQSSYEVLQQALGEAIAPAFEQIVRLTTSWINELIKTSGLFDGIAAISKRITDFFEQNPEIIKTINAEMTALVEDALQAASDLAGEMLDYLTQNPTAIADMIRQVASLVSGVFKAAVDIAKSILDYLQQNPKAIDDMVAALKTAVDWMGKFYNFVALSVDGWRKIYEYAKWFSGGGQPGELGRMSPQTALAELNRQGATPELLTEFQAELDRRLAEIPWWQPNNAKREEIVRQVYTDFLDRMMKNPKAYGMTGGGGTIGTLSKPGTVQTRFTDKDFAGTPGFVYAVPGGKITGDQGNQHRGLDVFAPVGTPVLASMSGTIVQAQRGGTVNTEDSDPGKPGYQYQHSVKIKLDEPFDFNGKTIRYMWNTHLTEIAEGIVVGAKVVAGQKLGEVGMAGGAPHLHQAFAEGESFRGNNPLSNRESLELLTAIKNQPIQTATTSTTTASNAPQINLTPKEREDMLKLMMSEATGEGVVGMAAVGRAVLNRSALIKAGIAPTGEGGYGAKSASVSDVIRGRTPGGGWQFSPLGDGRFEKQYSDSVRQQAEQALGMLVDDAALKQLGLSDATINSPNFQRYTLKNQSWWQGGVTRVKEHNFARDKFSVNRNVSDLVRQQFTGGTGTASTTSTTSAAAKAKKEQKLSEKEAEKKREAALKRRQESQKRDDKEELANLKHAHELQLTEMRRAQADKEDIDRESAKQSLEVQKLQTKQALAQLDRERKEILKKQSEKVAAMKAGEELSSEQRVADYAAELIDLDEQIALQRNDLKRTEEKITRDFVNIAIDKKAADAKQKIQEDLENINLEAKLDPSKYSQAELQYLNSLAAIKTKQIEIDKLRQQVAAGMSAEAEAAANRRIEVLQKELNNSMLLAESEYARAKAEQQNRQSTELTQFDIDQRRQALNFAEQTQQIGQRDLLVERATLDVLEKQLKIQQLQAQLSLGVSQEQQQTLRLQIAALEADIEKTKALTEYQLRQNDLQTEAAIAQAEYEQIGRLIVLAEKDGNVERVKTLKLLQAQYEFEQKIAAIKRQGLPQNLESQAIAAETQLYQRQTDEILRGNIDLGQSFRDLLSGPLTEFFQTAIDGSKSLGDAFSAMAKSILGSLAQIGAELATSSLLNMLGLGNRQQPSSGIGGWIANLFGFGGSALAAASPAGAVGGMPFPFMGKKFAEGGFTGKGGKWQPMGIVHGGEYVLNKEATAAIGLPSLNFMNRFNQLPEFALGGYVGNMENRLLSGLNAIQSPQISLPPNSNTPERRSAATTTNTVTVNINDKESRFYRQSRTLAREMASELRNV